MSALPPKPDMVQHGCDVRFMPKADIRHAVGSIYRKGRSPPWLRAKNPKAPALMQAEEDGGGDELQHCGVVSSLIPNSAESILFLASVVA
jgi:hypothetical protein